MKYYKIRAPNVITLSVYIIVKLDKSVEKREKNKQVKKKNTGPRPS